MSEPTTDGPATWLVLVYQFPQGPGSARVKIWRRLQSIGAVALKNSMYVLPAGDGMQEDFQWLLTELLGAGADAAIMEGRFLNGMDDGQIRAQFREARDQDYRDLVAEIEPVITALAAAVPPDDDAAQQARRLLSRARRRLADIETIDYFKAPAHEAAEAAVRRLGETLAGQGRKPGREETMKTETANLQGRVWVTRRNVGVDRISSAWLIRRFIDPAAEFRFVPARVHAPEAREIRFDMFEAEFTHEGDRCTFEALMDRVRPADPGLKAISEIVHDLDFKEDRFGRPETKGFAGMLAGLTAGEADDMARIDRGAAMLDDLYRFYSSPPEEKQLRP